MLDRVEAPSEQRVVVYTTEPLGEGRYQFDVSPTILSDVAGNAIVDPVSINFTSFDLDAENSVAWISDEDGNWNNAGNWSTGEVPGPNDAVIIDRLIANPTVSLPDGNVVIRSLVSREDFVMSGGSLTVSEPSEISAAFGITNGSTLTANGFESLFVVNGETAVGAISLFAVDGGVISLPQAGSLGQTSGVTSRFHATGVGSVLDLGNVTSIDMGPAHVASLNIQALAGGVVDLGSVTHITDAEGNAGSSSRPSCRWRR